MKRIVLFILFVFLLLQTVPLGAEISLASLKINESVNPGPENVYLTVTGVLSNGNNQQITDGLVWRSSDTSIATISSSGWLHFTGKGGPVTISVFKGGASGSKSFNVRPWPKSLDIETQLVYSQNPYRLMVKGKFSDDQERYFGPDDELSWSTSNPWVAWVNSQGVVSYTGEEGYLSIKATSGDLSDSVNLTVTTETQSSAWRRGIKIATEIKYSPSPQKLELLAIYSDDTEEVLENSSADWSSTSPDVAKIDSEGLLTFTGKPGYTTIKVSYGGYSYEKLVTVDRFIKSMTINQSLNFTNSWVGKPLPLSVTARYNDGTEFQRNTGVSWSVDNKKAASITDEGAVTFTGTGGKVAVSASIKGLDGEDITDSIVVEVPQGEKPVPLRLFIDTNPVILDQPIIPKAYCVFSDGSVREVTEEADWMSGTPDTASVFQGKLYFSPLPGPVRVTARYQGQTDQLVGYINHFNGSPQRVSQIIIKEHGLSFSYQPIQLTGLAVMGDGNTRDVTARLRWISSNPRIAKINKGLLTMTGRTGKVRITAEGYGFRHTLEMEITPPELKARVEKLVLEGELNKSASQLKARAFYNDGTEKEVTNSAVWNTSNKNIAVVSSNGTVMFIKGLKPVEISVNYEGMGASITYD